MNKPFRILWAEDEDTLREVMCELLSQEGYDCHGVHDGHEAKEALEKESFDMLITDFNMPRMDGARLLMWCREQDYHMPVIFVTASHERLPAEELAAGDCCTTIIQKPFSIEALLDKIERARARNHDFHCKGFTVPKHKADYLSNFPGQHLLPD